MRSNPSNASSLHHYLPWQRGAPKVNSRRNQLFSPVSELGVLKIHDICEEGRVDFLTTEAAVVHGNIGRASRVVHLPEGLYL
jgi:hypothetical protein